MNTKNILGGIPGLFDESEFEKESFLSSAVKGVIESTISLVKEDVAGIPSKTEVPEPFIDAFKNEPEDKLDPTKKFSLNGTIDFKNQAQKLEQSRKKIEQSQKEQKEAARQKAFFQTLKEDQERSERAKDKLLFEEEVNDIITNLPTEQKNELLHYQASYRDRSIYQRAELRKKLIEQRDKKEKQEKEVSIPSPAKQPAALEGAFEGRSGSQGGGTANLSAQAVG